MGTLIGIGNRVKEMAPCLVVSHVVIDIGCISYPLAEQEVVRFVLDAKDGTSPLVIAWFEGLDFPFGEMTQLKSRMVGEQQDGKNDAERQDGEGQPFPVVKPQKTKQEGERDQKCHSQHHASFGKI